MAASLPDLPAGTPPYAADYKTIIDALYMATDIRSARVDTSQTTTSTSFTDLATAGPAVTVTTGTSALVWVGARANCSTTNNSIMGFAISGASTVAGDDTKSYWVAGTNPVASGALFLVTGLTAGSNIFTCKYKVNADTGTWQYRTITVFPLP